MRLEKRSRTVALSITPSASRDGVAVPAELALGYRAGSSSNTMTTVPGVPGAGGFEPTVTELAESAPPVHSETNRGASAATCSTHSAGTAPPSAKE